MADCLLVTAKSCIWVKASFNDELMSKVQISEMQVIKGRQTKAGNKKVTRRIQQSLIQKRTTKKPLGTNQEHGENTGTR